LQFLETISVQKIHPEILEEDPQKYLFERHPFSENLARRVPYIYLELLSKQKKSGDKKSVLASFLVKIQR